MTSSVRAPAAMDHDFALPEPSADRSVTMLSVLVGGHPYLIDVMSIREIRGWSPSAPLPGGPAYVEGVCDLRGNVIPVISMVARLGLDCSRGAPTVTVVIEVDGRIVGVAVDSVCDLVSIPSDRLQPTPIAGGPAARELLSAVVELDGRVFGLIDFAQLTPFAAAVREPAGRAAELGADR